MVPSRARANTSGDKLTNANVSETSLSQGCIKRFSIICTHPVRVRCNIPQNERMKRSREPMQMLLCTGQELTTRQHSPLLLPLITIR